ncbi:MAG: hypothetical protein M1616_04770 [Candidatus Thermoplasmatota archaeon]|jgi:chorismate synthase|nr:hypothetical protein [Candidatus Thermoplasmatota archaeon]
MEIIPAEDPDEIGAIIPVIRSAWGMSEMAQIVKDTVAAMRFHGGLVLLAKDQGEVIGMSFSFPARFGNHIYLYSHMTGVLQDRKYSGIGQQLKLRQKEWALRQGYDLICWTFDPLMTLNANLNLGKLGGIARSYIPNFYGNMDDSLNRGNPTDRVVCEWWIREKRNPSERVNPTLNPAEGKELDNTIISSKKPFMLKIPEDFLRMKRETPEIASKVRLYYRETFRKIFSSGYVLTGFSRSDSAYIVTHSSEILPVLPEKIFPVR